MPTLEERVSYLEGKVDEHSRGFGEFRESIGRLEGKFDRLDEKVDRFREELAGRIDALDRKFVWLIGFQVTTLATLSIAVLGAVLAVFLPRA